MESAGLTIGNRGVWCARLDLNQHCTAFEAAASTGLDYGRIGRLGRIRTDTRRVLSALPLPVGLRAYMVFGARFELALMRPSTARVYQLAPPERANHKLSKIWRKAGDSNAYVLRDLA